MCDIYMAKCEKCKRKIDMHLADFDTGRDEVKVYCTRHIPKDTTEGCVWQSSKESDVPRRVYIKALTPNAKKNADGNHPNAFETDCIICFGKKAENKK